MKRLTTTTLLLGLLTTGAVNVTAQTPKIVVGIVVDQLRTDYLEQLRPYFGSNGFNRLIREGVYLQDVDFKDTAGDAATGAAIIYTGTWPTVNGVAGAEKLDATLKRNVPVLAADPSKSRADYTPANLRTSTIADEIYINNGPLTKIYSVTGDPQVAVITAGHAGTAAIWFDETTGRWTTPNYYGTLPPVVGNKARTSPLPSKIASTLWRPLHNASTYPMGSVWTDGDFSHGFSASNRDSYQHFRQSAPFNEEVTGVAIDLLKSIRTGDKDQPGMVNIEYTLAPITFDLEGDSRPELVDSYVRLDSEIGKLLDAIDQNYGKGNAMIFLSSTGYADEPSIPDGNARIPTGEITLKKAESLLNSYLSAAYGNADYVTLISGGKIYLDKKVADSKGVEMNKLRREAKAFLLRMGGVSRAYTLDEILGGDNRTLENLALGIDPKNSPDLLLFYSPGWTVTDDNVYPAMSEKVRLSSPLTPAFILAPETAAETISTTIDATAIAPTVTSMLRIRAPNAAEGKGLKLKNKN